MSDVQQIGMMLASIATANETPLEALAKLFTAYDERGEQIAVLQSQLDTAQNVWDELSVTVGCTSPDGSAEIGQVEYLQARIKELESKECDCDLCRWSKPSQEQP